MTYSNTAFSRAIKSRNKSRQPSHEARGGMWAVPQLNNLARPCPPITLNLDHFVSCYCLFYAIGYGLKLSMDACRGAFFSIVGNVIVAVLY